MGGVLWKGEAIRNLLEGFRGQVFEFGLEAVGNGEPFIGLGTWEKGFIEEEASNVYWLVWLEERLG